MDRKDKKIKKISQEELDNIVEEEKALTPNDIRKIILPYIRGGDMITARDKIVSYLLRKYKLITFSDTGEIYVYLEGIYTSKGMEILSKDKSWLRICIVIYLLRVRFQWIEVGIKFFRSGISPISSNALF